MEPDVRAASSHPVFAHFALTSMREAGLPGGPAAEQACGFLASAARDDGAVPYLLEEAMEHPRANHWQGDYALAEPALREER